MQKKNIAFMGKMEKTEKNHFPHTYFRNLAFFDIFKSAKSRFL